MHLLRRTVTLRITAPESTEPRAFEALVLLAKPRLVTERIRAETPFARTLPDCDATIVAMPTDAGAPLEVAYEVTRRGRSVMAARSWWPVALIERRRARIVAAGLDGPSGGDAAGTGAVLRAI